MTKGANSVKVWRQKLEDYNLSGKIIWLRDKDDGGEGRREEEMTRKGKRGQLLRSKNILCGRRNF